MLANLLIFGETDIAISVREDSNMQRSATVRIWVIASLALVLTSCSLLPLSDEEQAYKENCQIVYENYQDYLAVQQEFDEAEYGDPDYDWTTWSGGYVITNAGTKSRKAAELSIKRNYPWISRVIEENLSKMSRKEFLSQDSADLADEFLAYAAIESFFNEMAQGTPFTLTKKMLKLTNPTYENYSEPGINAVFASFAPSDRFKDCDSALGLDGESSMEETWKDYDFTGLDGVGVRSVSEIAAAIWGCNKYGAGWNDSDYVDDGVRKCAGTDFVYDFSASGPSEPTPEELEILEERRQDAEREAQNPPSSSTTVDVSPLQICTSLGAVVQTENYGQLTCKLVWLNRIKAMVWMRS